MSSGGGIRTRDLRVMSPVSPFRLFSAGHLFLLSGDFKRIVEQVVCGCSRTLSVSGVYLRRALLRGLRWVSVRHVP